MVLFFHILVYVVLKILKILKKTTKRLQNLKKTININFNISNAFYVFFFYKLVYLMYLVLNCIKYELIRQTNKLLNSISMFLLGLKNK